MNSEAILLGEGGPSVTRVGMGGCPLGGHGWGQIREDEARAAVRRAVELGIDFFDTADCYGFGHSERLLSETLGADRTRVTLATKFGVAWDEEGRTRKDTSPAYARQAVHASLERLGLDVLPLVYVHWPDGRTPIADTIGELARLRDEGKIRHIGVSNFDAAELSEALNETRIAALQVRMSLIHREALQGIAPLARRHGVAVVTWGSLEEGLLTGKFDAGSRFGQDDRRSRYPEFQGEAFERNLAFAERVREVAAKRDRSPAQVALRWLLDQASVSAVLFGAKRPAQVEDNAGALGWSLTDAERATLQRSSPNE